jgi:hypothetical protein
MYGALWRKLPGGLPGKLGGFVALFLGVLALLFFVAFPWIEQRLPWSDVTVNSPAIDAPVTPGPTPSVPATSPATLPGG